MGFPAVDDLTRLIGRGPSSGIALAILAIGSAILILALKTLTVWRAALPVWKEWKGAILEVKGNQLRQSARLHALAEQAETTEGRLEAMAGENARLKYEVAMLRSEVSRLEALIVPPPVISDPESEVRRE